MPDREQVLEAEIEQMEKAMLGTPPEEAPEQGEKTGATETAEGQPVQPVQAETTPGPQEEETAEYWKKRFTGIKAHNDSQSFTLNQQLTSQQKQLQELQERLVTAEAASIEQANVYEGVLTEEQQDILGEDAVDGMKAVTDAAVKAAVEPLLKEIKSLKASDAKRTTETHEASVETAKNTFLERLGKLAPGYKAIDTDPKFLSWMNDVDEASGFPRSHMFKTAQTSGDVGRVAQFFNEYSKLNNAGQEELKKKVTPVTQAPRKAAQKPNPESKFMLKSQIDMFYDSMTRGTWKGTDKERLAMERKIDHAVQHRLVRPG